MARLDGVLRRMREIGRTLRPDDGVARFNALYLRTTENIATALEAGELEQPDTVAHLDEAFADLYFAAIDAWSRDRPKTPKAWVPLLEARGRSDVHPLQFALAGMNAHINRDLAHALLATWRAFERSPERGGPEHRDFLLVNGVLEQTMAEIKPQLATGLVAQVDQALGELDDALALFSVAHARDNAWAQAEVYAALTFVNPGAAADLAEATDRFVGLASRALLRVPAPNA